MVMRTGSLKVLEVSTTRLARPASDQAIWGSATGLAVCSRASAHESAPVAGGPPRAGRRAARAVAPNPSFILTTRLKDAASTSARHRSFQSARPATRRKHMPRIAYRRPSLVVRNEEADVVYDC